MAGTVLYRAFGTCIASLDGRAGRSLRILTDQFMESVQRLYVVHHDGPPQVFPMHTYTASTVTVLPVRRRRAAGAFSQWQLQLNLMFNPLNAASVYIRSKITSAYRGERIYTLTIISATGQTLPILWHA